MKIKALLATLIGAVAIQGATAGEWCPPACEDKCPIECCADTSGSVSFGYDSEYVFKGVRFAGDSIWGDVNYTFDGLPLPLTLGVWHLTSLGTATLDGNGNIINGNDNYGDETNFYASVGLPSIAGFDHSIGYTFFLFPNTRFPQGTPNNGGDSTSQVSYTISREVFCGATLSYNLDYLFGATSDINPQNDELGGFLHTIDLSKSVDITDCLALDLSAGVYYNDNYFDDDVNAGHVLAGNQGNDSGWHAYYLRAALPVALSGCATLTPYIQYNGTPDGWTGDDLSSGFRNVNANRNDVFFGGVSINVGF